MNSNKKQKKLLGDFCSFKYGKTIRKSDISSEGLYPVFSGYQIVGYLDSFVYDEPQLLVVCRGVGGTGDIKISPPQCSITNLSIIISANKEIDKKYLYWVLRYADTHSIRTGSAQPQITINDLEKFPVEIQESLAEQKAIAHILGTLDKKIELNKKTNETLEGIAQAIFKSWFIDFDPVKAKSEGRSTGLPEDISELFPDSFAESELGMIPNNWILGNLSDVTTLTQGLAINSKTKFLLSETGLPLLRIKDLISGNSEQFINPQKAPIKTQVEKNEIIFTRTGRVGLVFREKVGVLHNNSFKVSCKEFCLGNEYLYWFLKQNKVYDYVNLIASGSVQKDLRHEQFLSIKIKIPPQLLCIKFGEILLPIKRSISHNESNNIVLHNLRESLQRNLLSGELRISEAEKIIEEISS